MASPYNGLFFSHQRGEEALNVLIWNKPQGILLGKQSKVKLASRICITNVKTQLYRVYICISVHPWRDTQETCYTRFFQAEGWWVAGIQG